MLSNLFLLCLALPGNYTKPMKIDIQEMYTVISSQTQLQAVIDTVCDIKLMDRCHSKWMCPPMYESLLPIKKPDVKYFIANTQTGTMAYTVKR